MSQTGLPKRMLAMSLLGVFVISGCATPNRGSNTSANGGSSADSNGCSAGHYVAGGLLGAVLGAAVGGKSGALKGGVIGAAITAAACMVIDSQSQQVKSASAVNEEYKTKNRGQLPATPTVQTYSTAMSPATGRVSKGNRVELTSRADVVDGSQTRIQKVEEELTLSLAGEKLTSRVKDMGPAGGSFENKFSIPIPAQFQDGAYTVSTRLLINGKPIAGSERQRQMIVATIDGSMTFALLEENLAKLN